MPRYRVYGVTMLQAYIYVRNSGRDSVRMRSFDVVTDFGDPSLLLHMPLTLAVLIRALTQWYVPVLESFSSDSHTRLASSHTVFGLVSLSKRNATLVSSICAASINESQEHDFADSHCFRSRDGYTDNDTFSFGSLKIRMLAGFANGLSAICDILITISLCYYLHSKRTGFKRYYFLL
ncbi:hypothetical protein LXA43DRAFT_1069331 [Ganoderma leucocontextum]|nr:hypothetical protein LXA43DRAFT_1069331 [Ganoderma leucocontextum]